MPQLGREAGALVIAMGVEARSGEGTKAREIYWGPSPLEQQIDAVPRRAPSSRAQSSENCLDKRTQECGATFPCSRPSLLSPQFTDNPRNRPRPCPTSRPPPKTHTGRSESRFQPQLLSSQPSSLFANPPRFKIDARKFAEAKTSPIAHMVACKRMQALSFPKGWCLKNTICVDAGASYGQRPWRSWGGGGQPWHRSKANTQALGDR